MAKLTRAAASARTKKGWQKRKRAKPKQPNVHGAFANAVHFADTGGSSRGEDWSHASFKDASGSTKRERGTQNTRDIQHAINTGRLNPEDVSYWKTRSDYAGPVRAGGPDIRRSDISIDSEVKVKTSEVKDVNRLRRDSSWRSERGVYTQEKAQRAGKQKQYTPTSRFIKTELAPSHQDWLNQALNDPTSSFNRGLNTSNRAYSGTYVSPGQRNRVKMYTEALQEGYSHEEALDRVRHDGRGRQGAPRGAARRGARTTGLEARNTQKGMKSRYEPAAPTSREFKVGMSSARVDKTSELKTKLPNASERDIIQVQQYQRMALGDELNKNQRWTHETKKATYMGQRAGQKEDPNRVVFFTTNLGYPAPSVPSDSLIGQYVIRKRKNFLRKEGVYSDKDLKGKFPEAVRDMHVIEASTGISFGAEGRWGAFQKSGYRRGAKKSKNFGKPTPLGSQVLIDSQGRPIYDAEGNIRYTEGATRPFELSTHKDVGFRVFVG